MKDLKNKQHTKKVKSTELNTKTFWVKAAELNKFTHFRAYNEDTGLDYVAKFY